MTCWKVSWNARRYDYQRIIHDFNNGDVTSFLQSKGNAPIVNLPIIDDIVYISCKGLKIMQCRVMSNFHTYDEPQNDIYAIGDNRPHAANYTYLQMQIIQTYNENEKFRGNQRTWTRTKYKQ